MPTETASPNFLHLLETITGTIRMWNSNVLQVQTMWLPIVMHWRPSGLAQGKGCWGSKLRNKYGMGTEIMFHIKLSCPCAFFNWAPCHEGILGDGGIALCIIDLGTRWRWVVSFMPWLLYPQWQGPWYLWIGGCMGPRASLNVVVKRKILSLCWDRTPNRPVCHQQFNMI
jgi:hypothetical protein